MAKVQIFRADGTDFVACINLSVVVQKLVAQHSFKSRTSNLNVFWYPIWFSVSYCSVSVATRECIVGNLHSWADTLGRHRVREGRAPHFLYYQLWCVLSIYSVREATSSLIAPPVVSPDYWNSSTCIALCYIPTACTPTAIAQCVYPDEQIRQLY